jgi:hypothetical protein
MDSNGEHAHKLFESGDESAIGTVSWFSDGQRVEYLKDDGSSITAFTRDLKGGAPIVVETPTGLKGRDIGHGLSLPDGRAILSVSELGTIGETCNFWMAQNDPRTGKPIGTPRQLTNWSGFCMDPTSVTKDGRQVAFLEYWGHPTVNVADLQAGGKRIGNARHFTLTESRDLVTDWTADSKSLILYSNRAGRDGIYRQSLAEDNAQPLVILQDPFGDPHVTPDGKWVLYVLYPKEDDRLGVSRIMRVPITGGSSSLVLTARPSSTIRCARFPSELCVVAQRSDDRKQVAVTAFDPIKGLGSGITQFPLDPNEDRWSLDLSPDGTRLAAILSPGGPIHILPLHGGSKKKIHVRNWSNLLGLKWAADGRGLFVFSRVREEAVLLHVDPEGNAELLWENRGGNYSPGLPSPDGRHMAIQSTADNKNLWMMENF